MSRHEQARRRSGERCMRDRRVHATGPYGDVVRYDIRGHWRVEKDGENRRVSIPEAVAVAMLPGMVVTLGVRGGSTFDRHVKRAMRSILNA